MLFLSLQNLHFNARNFPKCDGVELRLDLFDQIDKTSIEAFCIALGLPVLFTLRKADQGGHFTRTEEQRLALLADLLSLSPAFVDIEYNTDPVFIQFMAEHFPKTRILLSYHNFDNTPQDLHAILAQMASPYAYGYKIATFAHSTLDALRMLQFVRNHTMKISGICMGDQGKITRILGPIFGNFIDYAIIDEKEITASGQLTLDELNSIYSYHALNPSTALYGLIGDPIDRSLGHVVHNALMRHHHWDAVYVKMRVTQSELPDFLPLAKDCGFRGLSVTMPLKEAICPFIEHMDSDAQKIGAVNTLLLASDGIYGYNADAKGALDALEQKTLVHGKKIVLIGAGGAARAIAFEAKHRGASVTILNRTAERALSLAKELGCNGGGLDELTDLSYDIAINATPAAIDDFPFIAKTVAMDIKNRPQMTPFLCQAEEQGCILVFGYQMFINQALEQIRLWFGVTASHEFLENTYLDLSSP